MAGRASKVLALANCLLSHVGMATRVYSLEDCNSTLFAQLYEILTGDRIRFHGDGESSKCQCVVDLLSQQLSGHVSFEHIRGAELALQDVMAISNLLDVFSVLFHLHWDDPNDSNALSQDGIDVISDVLEEEGISSNTYSSTSTADLLLPVPHSRSVDATPLISRVDNSLPTLSSPPLLTPSPPHTPPHTHKPLLSPLHHSTPHATTRSRVYNQEVQRSPQQTHCSFSPQPTSMVQQQATHSTGDSIVPPSTCMSVSASFFPETSSHLTVTDIVSRDLHTTADTSSHVEASTILTPSQPTADTSTILTPSQLTADTSTILTPSQLTADTSTILTPSQLTADTSVDSPFPPDGQPTSAKESSLDVQMAVARARVLETLCQNFIKSDKVKHKKSKRRQNKHAASQYKPAGKIEKPSEKVGVEDPILPLVEEEFPFLHLSPSMMRRMWQKQVQQVAGLTKTRATQQQSAAKRVVESQQKHTALLQIIKKELDHTRRMQRQFEEQREAQAIKMSLHSKRHATARARRYFNDYELRLRAKLQRQKTREEQVFRSVFEEGLELQKERVRELRRYAKEKRQEHAKKHQDQLESMENYYHDQFAMLAENLAKERAEVTVRDKAKNQLVQRLRRELRSKLEGEIQQLQETLDREDDVVHFREVDAGALRRKLAQLSFSK